jgi:hypothetical protein
LNVLFLCLVKEKVPKRKTLFAALIRFTLIRTPPAPRVLRGILVLRSQSAKFSSLIISSAGFN